MPFFVEITSYIMLYLTPINLSWTQSVSIDNYTLVTNYCRRQKEKGGVCMYVKSNIISKSLNLETHGVDKDFEVCGVKLNTKSKKCYVLAIYRPPSGNFNKFMKLLESIIHQLYKPKCGDVNINYLEGSNRVKQLNTLCKTFNLVNIITALLRRSQLAAPSTCYLVLFSRCSRGRWPDEVEGRKICWWLVENSCPVVAKVIGCCWWPPISGSLFRDEGIFLSRANGLSAFFVE
jgi:hypothetical protein